MRRKPLPGMPGASGVSADTPSAQSSMAPPPQKQQRSQGGGVLMLNGDGMTSPVVQAARERKTHQQAAATGFSASAVQQQGGGSSARCESIMLTPTEIEERALARRPCMFPIFSVLYGKSGKDILLGGGGGAKGMGVASGVCLCHVDYLSEARDPRDVLPVCAPFASVDSRDEIVLHMTHHPTEDVVAACIANRVVGFARQNNGLFKQTFNVQTDFSKDGYSTFVAFTHDGTRLASAGADKTVCVYDYGAASGLTNRVVVGEVADEVMSLCWSADDSRLACVSLSGKTTGSLWTLRGGQWSRAEVQTALPAHLQKGIVNGLRFMTSGEGKHAKEWLYAGVNLTARGPGVLLKLDAQSLESRGALQVSRDPLAVTLAGSSDWPLRAGSASWPARTRCRWCVGRRTATHSLPRGSRSAQMTAFCSAGALIRACVSPQRPPCAGAAAVTCSPPRPCSCSCSWC
jgi:hypothetical protein